jgi:hypothetical protein
MESNPTCETSALSKLLMDAHAFGTWRASAPSPEPANSRWLVSRKERAGPRFGTGPEECYAERTAYSLPLQLLTALLAKQNSTAREEPVHSIEPASPCVREILSPIVALGAILTRRPRFRSRSVRGRYALPRSGRFGFVAPCPYALPVHCSALSGKRQRGRPPRKDRPPVPATT